MQLGDRSVDGLKVALQLEKKVIVFSTGGLSVFICHRKRGGSKMEEKQLESKVMDTKVIEDM